MSLKKRLDKLFEKVEDKIIPIGQRTNEICRHNTEKVLNAFLCAGVGEEHLKGTTGYGYNDLGRDAIESVYAKIFNAELAFVRPQVISGTHAITACLFGNLRPNDEVLSITGKPYDTLLPILGMMGNISGSLKEYNIVYKEAPLVNGDICLHQVFEKITKNTKMIYIQRSKGYDLRPSVNMERLKYVIKEIEDKFPNVIVFVDNCYGEFVEKLEPLDMGAHLIAGSLIKNPGGGLASSGGYICGKHEYVKAASDRAVAPGLGLEMGPALESPRLLLQGIFMAPHVVGQALKGAALTAGVFEEIGFPVQPRSLDERSDIVQIIEFGDKGLMLKFCQEIQRFSPIDSRLTVEPGQLPGYDGKVVMACGAFVQGSSIELSADGPMREPFACFFQGGLTYEHIRLALYKSLYNLFDGDIIDNRRLNTIY